MTYKIIVSPIASKNIDNAVTYYLEEVSKKVANDFLKDYKKTYRYRRLGRPFKKIRITFVK